MINKNKIFYIVRWWDHSGILKISTKELNDEDGYRCIEIKGYGCSDDDRILYIGEDAFYSEDEAREQIEELITRKKIDLNMQLDRINKMNAHSLSIKEI